ncbi:Aminopeptidase N [Planctomycetes bacterium Pan216]|uniref:Aminopeptidase N n=1 Tax=Kolteria novifilia TaxID=2527975 RepID=A0A518BCA9_9BACT|nr:Aminopeptidase N [Planctomycetes bacterium Pan216]
MPLARQGSLWVILVVVGTIVGEEKTPYRTAADRPIDVKHIRLDLEVFLEDRKIAGDATITFAPLRSVRSVRFDAVDHVVESVRDAKTKKDLSFENTGKQIVVDFGEPLPVGEEFSLIIDYAVREPKAGLYFFGPSEKEPDEPLMVWSQGEPISNRHWFPSLDHPNERQTTEILATVPEGIEVLSNGRLVSRDKLGDKRRVRYHWKQSKPHVAYLVTLVAGRFNVGRTQWRGIPVTFYVPPDRQADIERTFGRTTKMLDFFSERFGIDYPWEKYAQVVVHDFIAGGMENTSATTLYDRVMHDERAMLDSSPDWLIAHELGHQWWGDLVTCKDWSHLWLNEGFATLCELLWSEEAEGQDEYLYSLLRKSRAARGGGGVKTRPIVDRHYRNPRSMFDARAYPKGAWVLHMLRHLLGDDAFFEAVASYGNEYRYRTAETADFRRSLERSTGRSLERFFYDWTQRPGHPELEVESKYLPEDRLVQVDVKQTQEGEPFQFPLTFELRTDSSDASRRLTHQITEKEVRFFLPAAKAPTMILVDPDVALLADLKEIKSNDLWKKQALEGPSVVDRIRAVEHFAESKSPADVELLTEVLKNDSFQGVRSEAAAALAKVGGETASEALIAALEDDHPKVRRSAAKALGDFVGNDEVVAALSKAMKKGDKSYFVEAELLEAFVNCQRFPEIRPLTDALGKTSHGEVIRRAALRGLGKSRDPIALDVLLEWSSQGKPNRCRVEALRALANYLRHADIEEKEKKLALDAIAGALNEGGPRVRGAAIETLRDLGRESRPALPVLASLAKQDPDTRVRELAEKSLAKIKAETPVPVELGELQEELEKLRKGNKLLTERLEKLESKSLDPLTETK